MDGKEISRLPHLLKDDGEDSAGGLVHVALGPRPGHGVHLVDEDDRPAHLFAGVEDRAQLLLGLPVPLGHDALHGDVNHGAV